MHKTSIKGHRKIGDVTIPLTECLLHGRCVDTKEQKSLLPTAKYAVCEGCSDFVELKVQKVESNPQRHLIYHIWPRRGSDWKVPVQMLLDDMHKFDGVRSIGIAIGDDSETVDDVKAMFYGHRIDNWVIAPNEAWVREGTTFFDLLRTLPQNSGHTFFGHAKGVHPDRFGMPSVKRWTEMMHKSLLTNVKWIEQKLRQYPMVGCFKQHFNKPQDRKFCDFGPCDWQYEGAFFWFRNADVFANPNWSKRQDTWLNVEFWPGQMFEDHQTLCILGDNAGTLYYPDEVAKFETDFSNLIERQRSSAKFCYFTGTNRLNERPMIVALLHSMRKAGVTQDLHVFAPFDVPGAINHRISPRLDWNNHMAKLGFLRQLTSTDYEYFCWLDTDTWFVRHPGDLSELIRDEPIWISMESDLAAEGIRFEEWWDCWYSKKTPTIFDTWDRFGAGRYGYWNTNGGLWIVRKNAMQQFSDRCFEIYNTIRSEGNYKAVDEVPFSIVGNAMVSDPRLNTFDKHSHLWACDFQEIFKDRFPDNKPWQSQDYLTGNYGPFINPAIVHMMRGKELLRRFGEQLEAKLPFEANEELNNRINQHLDVFPCRYRGDLVRLETKTGGCAMSPSPVCKCLLPSNADGEASLWQFCSTQTMPICLRCEFREKQNVPIVPRSFRLPGKHIRQAILGIKK